MEEVGTPPHSCGGCPSRWWGGDMAHCACCHKTFGGVTGFDLHRVDGSCATPRQLASRKLREVRPGVWGTPAGSEPPESRQEGVDGASQPRRRRTGVTE